MTTKTNPMTPASTSSGDLVVTVNRETGAIQLVRFNPDGVDVVGTYASAAEAWSAVDRIDSPRS